MIGGLGPRASGTSWGGDTLNPPHGEGTLRVHGCHTALQTTGTTSVHCLNSLDVKKKDCDTPHLAVMQCTRIALQFTAVHCSALQRNRRRISIAAEEGTIAVHCRIRITAAEMGYDGGTVGIRRILGSILASVRHLLQIRSG